MAILVVSKERYLNSWGRKLLRSHSRTGNKKALRSFRMLNPLPARSAFILSPIFPLRWFLSIRWSSFRCPMIGSIADLRLSHFRSAMLDFLFRRPGRRTFMSEKRRVVPRYPLSQNASIGVWPVMLLTCSIELFNVCPS